MKNIILNKNHVSDLANRAVEGDKTSTEIMKRALNIKNKAEDQNTSELAEKLTGLAYKFKI